MQHLTFDHRDALMAGLADQVTHDLEHALKSRHHAALAVPGGTTPAPFLKALACKEIDWSKVAVTLTDERWVPPAHERSNERLLRGSLLQDKAKSARFVPLYLEAPAPEDRLGEIDAAIGAHCQPFDVVVLGMGDDAHTASLFPGADRLVEALSRETSALVLPMRAPGALEPRITLTLRALLNAKKTYILITGERKRAVIAQAGEADDLSRAPVAAVLKNAKDLAIAWAP